MMMELKKLFNKHFAERNMDNKDDYYLFVTDALDSARDYDNGDYYHDPDDVYLELHDLLDQARKFVRDDNHQEAWDICSVMLREVLVSIHDLPDYQGETTHLTEQITDSIGDIWESCKPQIKSDIFEFLYDISTQPGFLGSDVHNSILCLMAYAVTNINQEESFLTILDKCIDHHDAHTEREWMVARLIGCKINMYKQLGRPEVAMQVMKENLQYHNIREKLISTLIEGKNYAEANELCLQGIQNAISEKRARYINSYHALLLKIAEQTENIPEQRKWLEEIFWTEYFSLDRYIKLESLYPEEHRAKFRDRTIARIQSVKSSSQVEKLAMIYKHDNMNQALLELIQEMQIGGDLLEKYAAHLAGDFPCEILQLFEALLQKISQVADTNAYPRITRCMKQMLEIEGGKPKVIAIRDFYKLQYKNRKAMMRELNDNFSAI